MNPSAFLGKSNTTTEWHPWVNTVNASTTGVAQQGLPTYNPTPIQDYGSITQGNGISLLDKLNRQPIVELAQKAWDSPFGQVADIGFGMLGYKGIKELLLRKGMSGAPRVAEKLEPIMSRLYDRTEFGLPTKITNEIGGFRDNLQRKIYGQTAREMNEEAYNDMIRDVHGVNPGGFADEIAMQEQSYGIHGTEPASSLQDAVNRASTIPKKKFTFGGFDVSYGLDSDIQYITRDQKSGFGYRYDPKVNVVSDLSFSTKSGVPYLRHIDELLPSKSTLDLTRLSLSGDSSPLLAKIVQWAEKHPEKYKVSSEQTIVPFNNLGKHTELSRLMRENPELAHEKAKQVGLNPYMGSFDSEDLDRMIGLPGSANRRIYEDIEGSQNQLSSVEAEHEELIRRNSMPEEYQNSYNDYPGGHIPPIDQKSVMVGSYFPTYIQKLFGLGFPLGLGTDYIMDRERR